MSVRCWKLQSTKKLNIWKSV